MVAIVATMAEYQITQWREFPSMVVAREGDVVVKVQLAPRFQEAIDEAAMRLGDTDADAYLEGWNKTPWSSAEGAPADIATAIAADLDARFPADALSTMLDALNG